MLVLVAYLVEEKSILDSRAMVWQAKPHWHD